MENCGWPMVNLMAISALMFFGALGAGALPIFTDISRKRANSVSGAAAGVLLGSVLGVIIPEGFHSLHEVTTGDEHNHSRSGENPSWMAGGSMLLGFVVMMVLEAFANSQGHQCTKLGEGLGGNQRGKDDGHVLLGLIIHSVADGIAVGTAALSPDGCVGLLVGIAMVLHKGPVAFGVTAYFSSISMPLQRIKRDLLLFSSASPLAAIAVYALHGFLPDILGSTNIGYLLLFSGGTFLFVACTHVIPRLLDTHDIPSSKQIVAVVFGSIIPLCFSSWLGHGH